MSGRRLLAGVLVLVAAWTSTVEARAYPWLGVRIRDLSEQEMEELASRHGVREGFGVYIVDVVQGAPAAKAGLKQGDIVVAVNGRPMVETRLLQRVLAAVDVENDVRLTVLRTEGRRDIVVRLTLMPPQLAGERTAVDFGFVLREPETARQAVGRTIDRTPSTVASIVAIIPRSPAERAGLTVGDVVVAVDGRSVTTADGAREVLADVDPTRPVRLTVRRGQQERAVTLTPR
ncbi:MAG: PDZ domain-containing protein [Candidatus Rokubacteria bacterium]|nr:PDZ domain-containing protein [Candidatus Rokubacteria bacterium]